MQFRRSIKRFQWKKLVAEVRGGRCRTGDKRISQGSFSGARGPVRLAA